MPCAACPSPSLQHVTIHSAGAVAAAVDDHGGVHVFDLSRHSRARVWQEGPFSGGLCFARCTELLFSVKNKVRVIDSKNHQHLISLLGHKEDVTSAAATELHAVTLSSDRLMLWRVSDWSLVRRVESTEAQLLATSLTCNQVAALYRPRSNRGRLTWSLWTTECSQLVDGVPVPRLDGTSVMCLAQLACGEGFVSMVARKKKDKKTHEVLVWKVPSRLPGGSAIGGPWRLKLQPVEQLLARQRKLFVVTASEVLVVEVPTGQVQHVAWPGLTLLDVSLSGLAVGLSRGAKTFAMKQLLAQRQRSASKPKLPLPSQSIDEGQALNLPSHAAKVAQLSQFLQRFGGFGKGQRPQCWQTLLQLSGDQVAYDQLCDVKLDRPRERVVQCLMTWRGNHEEKAAALAATQLAFCVFDDEVLSFELASKLLTNWLDPIARAKQQLLQWAERSLRVRDLELSIYLEVLVKNLTENSKEQCMGSLLWPMVSCLMLRCLTRSVCMVLWDHLILSWRKPWLLFLAACSILRCKRQLLLHLSPSAPEDVLKLVMSATETDPVELLREFHSLCETEDGKDLWKELEAQPAEPEPDLDVGADIDLKVCAEAAEENAQDKETQTEEPACEADFAPLISSFSASAHNEDANELEKNEFLRFRAAIHASGDTEPSTVLPSQPTLETEIKAGLARLNTSLDSTMDWPDLNFSDSGMDLCTA